MKNYIPFIRQATVTIGTADIGDSGLARVQTKINDLATGGSERAHINDVIIHPADVNQDTLLLKMRPGIYGKQYLTEDFYDVKVFEDGNYATAAVWKFLKPYRVYPGERFTVYLGGESDTTGNKAWIVAGVMFNGVKVNTGEPVMLWDVFAEDAANIVKGYYRRGLNALTLQCTEDSPVDLYSLSLNENEITDQGRRLSVDTGIGRPFCPKDDALGWVDIKSTPIVIGENWVLGIGETLVFDFETAAAFQEDHIYYVTVRGCMEVTDERG